MIQSMTGFAKVEESQGKLLCQVEMRTVNSRHLDARIFLPKAFLSQEEETKRLIRQFVTRGKLDCHVSLSLEGESEERLCLNPEVLTNLKSLRGQLEESLGQSIPMDMNALMQVKGLFNYEQPQMDEKEALALIRSTIEKACKELVAMRSREGELLGQEIDQRLQTMKQLIDQVEPLREDMIQAYKERLLQRIEKMDLSFDKDDPRLMQEIGLMIDRSDVTEEIERFNTHLVHFAELMVSGEPVGRKMDFMMQEFNREANTLCSKAGNSAITEIGVNLKVEIEKIREQVQNIE